MESEIMPVDSGDVAWMLIGTALVWLMPLPGLALFHGGLVRAKNLLSVMAQVIGIAAATVLLWGGLGAVPHSLALVMIGTGLLWSG